MTESTPKTRKRSRKVLQGEALEAFDAVHQTVTAPLSSEPPSASSLLEAVLRRPNMQLALRRVMSNKGCPGWDGMPVEALPAYLKMHWLRIRDQLLTGTYEPELVQRSLIPKASGGMRKLGIPTVVDRVIQQALQQVLTGIFDPTFSERSFGFRPGRSGHQAIDAAHAAVKSGRSIVVDIDLDSFFDRVHHDRLMNRLSQRITDKRVLRLIGRYLRAGILDKGLISTPDEGTPQGGPLSPLLSNVVLDELDKELERRGHQFVRYADDCNIYVRSERAGHRVMSGVCQFIEKKLKLKVNTAKSAVAKVWRRKFLGFSFTSDANPRVRISDQALKRFKERIRSLTRQRNRDLRQQATEVTRYTQGWMGYFGRSDLPHTFAELDGWIRRRFRVLHLKRWRTPRTRFREFRKLGLSAGDCYFLIRTTKRYWYLSSTRAVNAAINLRYLTDLGLLPMSRPAKH